MTDALTRPRSVTVALALIAAGALLGLLRFVVNSLTATAPRPASWLALTMLVVAYALIAGLVMALLYGRRWAYWVWIAVFALSLLLLDVGFESGLAWSPVDILGFTLGAIATALLLTRAARQWYGVGRKRMSKSDGADPQT